MSEVLDDKVRRALSAFRRLPLEELPSEVLMERMDRKFPFHVSRIAEVISGLEEEYDVLEAADHVVSLYESVYFDTSDFEFFRNHHRGKPERIKIRYRSYPNTDTHFLEVKRKNNRLRTSKNRILILENEFPFTRIPREFLYENADSLLVDDLQPVVTISYKRLGFIKKDKSERFSIDFDLHYRVGDRKEEWSGLSVAEVKQDKIYSSPAIRHLRKLRLPETGMSKYCLAMRALYPELKSGGFKPQARMLNKITHGQTNL